MEKFRERDEKSRQEMRKLINGTDKAPQEFYDIAEVALAGHIEIKVNDEVVKEISPTCIEFYYHEEQADGIKDYIVYHRNKDEVEIKDKKKRPEPVPLFPFGLLNNHQSGIDITFEHESPEGTLIRASMLIREFMVVDKDKVDGEISRIIVEDRSTYIYEHLYQRSLFRDISVKWVDGEKEVDVISSVRKNVAQFDKDGNRTKEKDSRKWQFRKKKMINDVDTNVVYLSSWLKSKYPAFYNKLVGLLQGNGIACRLLEGTNDIWARDYMPIQIYEDYFVQYIYNPDYLQKPGKRRYITNTEAVCKHLPISCRKTDLVIDGGNVVKAGKYVIMTEKVYVENKQYTKEEINEQLSALFRCDLIMLPWDKKNEEYGHADGIVKAIDDHTVLMTNYRQLDSEAAKMADSFKQILSKYFIVHELNYEVDKVNLNSWAYINFLRVGNVIILPALGIPEDEQALKQIKHYHHHPQCKVLQIDASEIVKKGGALNCITWNIKQYREAPTTRPQ